MLHHISQLPTLDLCILFSVKTATGYVPILLTSLFQAEKKVLHTAPEKFHLAAGLRLATVVVLSMTCLSSGSERVIKLKRS